MERSSCSGGCKIDYHKKQQLTILNNYIDNETSRLCNKDFFQNQPVINNVMRVILFDWILSTSKLWPIPLAGTATCFQIIDRYLTAKPVKINELQPIGMSALFLSEIVVYNGVHELSKYADLVDDFNSFEIKIYDVASTLGFKLQEPNVYHYLNILISLNPELEKVLFSPGTGKRREYISHDYSPFDKAYLESIISVRFSCLPVSLQVASILKHLGIWNDNLAIQLRKSEVQATAGEAIVGSPKTILRNVKTFLSIYGKFSKAGEDKMTPKFLEILDQIVVSTTKEESLLKTLTIEEYAKQFPKGKLLGKGTYGTVFISTNMVSKTEVAIKELNIKNIGPENTIENIVSEMGMYCYLTGNQGIVKIFSSFCVPRIFFVQELQLYEDTLKGSFDKYIGKDLMSYLKRILRPVFIGIKYIHERGFTHGDIKPLNILVDNNGEGVLADFGLLKRYPEPYRQLAYTEQFRPPDLFVKSVVDSTADIWAMGTSILSLFFDWTWGNESEEKKYTFIKSNLEFIPDPILQDLISHMCTIKIDRWTAEQCLQHKFWS